MARGLNALAIGSQWTARLDREVAADNLHGRASARLRPQHDPVAGQTPRVDARRLDSIPSGRRSPTMGSIAMAIAANPEAHGAE